jgi:uncharacterized protein YjlB
MNHAMTERTALELVTVPLYASASIPNNEVLPLLLYRGVVRVPDHDPDPARGFESLFAENDWAGGWRNGIYPFPHFHTTAHEVLGIYGGSARVQLGGEEGVVVTVARGDVVVIPAGVAHQCLYATGDLAVVGAYAGGRTADLARPDPLRMSGYQAAIREVPLPKHDPVYGRSGPVLDLWG